MEKLLLIGFASLLLLLSGCIYSSEDSRPLETTVDTSEFLQDVYCDAAIPCPAGYECAKFPGIDSPVCYPENREVCDFVQCKRGSACVVLESYPVQVFCS